VITRAETAEVYFELFTLGGPFAQGDQLRADRNALGDFHANHSFERFQFTRVRNREPQQQLFEGILLADIIPTAACVPIVVAPARIRTECAGFNPRFSAMTE